MTNDVALALAASVKKGQPFSWVDAAKAFAEWAPGIIRDYGAMLENLTATQSRCTELLEENRRLKARICPPTEGLVE